MRWANVCRSNPYTYMGKAPMTEARKACKYTDELFKYQRLEFLNSNVASTLNFLGWRNLSVLGLIFRDSPVLMNS
eukprot:snap_masked-scaffold_1-processed-gene-5.13-mRNA-1 protein AED:1.00 eAED:1.00 QI:0/-1/0/0/-1/1/1/0/74